MSGRVNRRDPRIRTVKVSITESWIVEDFLELQPLEQFRVWDVIRSLRDQRRAAVVRAAQSTTTSAAVNPSPCCNAESIEWFTHLGLTILRCPDCQLLWERPARARPALRLVWSKEIRP